MTFEAYKRGQGRPMKEAGLRVAKSGKSIALPLIVRNAVGQYVYFQIDNERQQIAVSKGVRGNPNCYRLSPLGTATCAPFLRRVGMSPGWYPGELITLNGVMSLVVSMDRP